MNASERFKRLVCTDAIRGDLRRSSVRAASYTWASGMVDFALRIGSTAILARLLLPEHFGVVMMVTAVTAIAEQFKDLGLSTATVQQKDITHEQVTNLFWINLSAGIAIAGIVCAVAPIISTYYKDPRLTPITWALSFNFLCSGLMVQHQALLTRRLQLGYTSFVRLLSSIVSTVLAVALAYKGFGYWSLVWREVIRSALLTVGMWVCFPWLPGLPYWRTSVKEMLKFGADLSAANIFGSAASGADRFLIGRYWGADSVGFYRQAFQLLIMPVDQLLSPVYQVTQPGLSMLQNDPVRFRQFYRKVLTVVCFVTMPLCLFVAVYASEITRLLLGKNWGNAAPILLLLSFSAFIRQPIGSTAFILITRGKSRTYLNLTLAQIIVSLISMFIGVHWGIKGVAIADVVTNYVMMFPRLHYSLRNSPFSIANFFGAILRPVTASVLMGLSLWLIRYFLPLPTPYAVVLGCVSAALLFPSFWLLMPGGKVELFGIFNDLWSALQKKRAKAAVTEAAAVTS